MSIIADESILFASPDPTSIYCYSPSLCHGFDNRIVAALDLGGPGTVNLPGKRSSLGDAKSGNQLRLFYSDNHGHNWSASESQLPLLHENLFRAGDSLYLIGHSGQLLISRSVDNGVSWSEPTVLDNRHLWQDGVGRIDHCQGRVYVS